MAIKRGEQDNGLDFAAVTVKARGSAGQAGEVPFLFSAKNLEIKGPADNMAGTVAVPSYRGSTFFDTIGRGGASGWDWQKVGSACACVCGWWWSWWRRRRGWGGWRWAGGLAAKRVRACETVHTQLPGCLACSNPHCRPHPTLAHAGPAWGRPG